MQVTYMYEWENPEYPQLEPRAGRKMEPASYISGLNLWLSHTFSLTFLTYWLTILDVTYIETSLSISFAYQPSWRGTFHAPHWASLPMLKVTPLFNIKDDIWLTVKVLIIWLHDAFQHIQIPPDWLCRSHIYNAVPLWLLQVGVPLRYTLQLLHAW